MTPRLDAADIITQATMATTLVKMLVDLVKLCWGGDGGRPPTWVPPLASLLCGIVVLMLLSVALDQDLTQTRVLASTVLAGLMAAVGAIGVTELHRLARQAGPGAIEASTPLSLSASKVAAGFTPSLTLPRQGGGDATPSPSRPALRGAPTESGRGRAGVYPRQLKSPRGQALSPHPSPNRWGRGGGWRSFPHLASPQPRAAAPSADPTVFWRQAHAVHRLRRHRSEDGRAGR